MTTPTKERVAQIAREEKWCNRQLKANEWVCTTDQLHAFAIRVLAEKENRMTEHYTQEEAVKLAREFGVVAESVWGITDDEIHSLINAAVTRKLAEKELEVLKLREALEKITPRFCAGYEIRYDALSTLPSTEALVEYVAEKVKELEPKARRWEWIRYNCLSVKTIGTNTISADEKAIDAAIEAEKASE